jgi:hypothetical protein
VAADFAGRDPSGLTPQATWRKVGELLDLFSEEECANYFKASLEGPSGQD